MKNKKSIVLAAVSAAVFASISVGTTFALFTSKAETNIEVSSGKINVSATLNELNVYSAVFDSETEYHEELQDETREEESGLIEHLFSNGGYAAYDSDQSTLIIDRITPGDLVKFSFGIANTSNVSFKYRFSYVAVDTDENPDTSYLDLVTGMDTSIKVGSAEPVTYHGLAKYHTAWEVKSADASLDGVEFSLSLPVDAGNEFQDKEAKILISFEAIQANAYTDGDAEIVLVEQKACVNPITNAYYNSLSEAFNALQNNETLIILKDDYTLNVADLSAAQTLNNKKITLNLNGKKLVSNGSRFEIGQNSELTINGNGSIEVRGIGKNDSGILVSDNSTLNFENGSLFVENNEGGYNKTYGIFGSNNSIINIGKTGTEGPTIEAGVALTTNGSAQFEGCTFNVYSGTLIGNRTQGDGDSNVVQLANTAGTNTINIYGGKFIQNTAPTDGLNTIFELRYGGTKNININGGEFVCGQYMFRFNATAHRSNVNINDQTGMDYEIYYKCSACAAGTH